jgi:hypothetical protein
MKTIAIAVLLVFSVFSSVNAEDIIKEGPFKGIDADKLHKDFRTTLLNANEDFVLLQQGKEARHAKPNKDIPPYMDGGTHTICGEGYRIVIYNKYGKVGGVFGVMRGPMLIFDPSEHWHANFPNISDLRFSPFKTPEPKETKT